MFPKSNLSQYPIPQSNCQFKSECLPVFDFISPNVNRCIHNAGIQIVLSKYSKRLFPKVGLWSQHYWKDPCQKRCASAGLAATCVGPFYSAECSTSKAFFHIASLAVGIFSNFSIAACLVWMHKKRFNKISTEFVPHASYDPCTTSGGAIGSTADCSSRQSISQDTPVWTNPLSLIFS